MAPGPVEAAGTVDAQTAPTAPWKTLRVFHELPQAILSTKSPTDRLNHPQILLRNQIIFGLAQGFVVLDHKADQSVTPLMFSISATYSYGEKTVSEKTTIDFRPYKASMHPPSVVVDELKQIREQLEKIAAGAERMRREAP